MALAQREEEGWGEHMESGLGGDEGVGLLGGLGEAPSPSLPLSPYFPNCTLLCFFT